MHSNFVKRKKPVWFSWRWATRKFINNTDETYRNRWQRHWIESNIRQEEQTHSRRREAELALFDHRNHQ